MRSRLALVGCVLVAAFSVASASAAVTPYKTDAQAEKYVERGLKRWAGIDLRHVDVKFAFCINGFYSRFEAAHRQHFDQERVNRYGEYLFRSFACTARLAATPENCARAASRSSTISCAITSGGGRLSMSLSDSSRSQIRSRLTLSRWISSS
jgi:hypothetical protein